MYQRKHSHMCSAPPQFCSKPQGPLIPESYGRYTLQVMIQKNHYVFFNFKYGFLIKKYARPIHSCEEVTYSSGICRRTSRTRVRIHHRMEHCFPWLEFRRRNYDDKPGGEQPNFPPIADLNKCNTALYPLLMRLLMYSASVR